LAELNRQLVALRDQFATKTAEQLELKAKAEVGPSSGALQMFFRALTLAIMAIEAMS
jgi:hypothetical protein